MIELELDLEALDAPSDGDRADTLSRRGEPSDRVRLIVVDSDALSRRAVVDALRLDGRFAVIAQAEDDVEAVELARHYRPRLVVIATAVPGMNSVGVIEQIVDRAPEVRVVLLSAVRELEFEMRAVRAGASGFLEKSAGFASIAHALTLVAAGESVISRDMTRHLVDRLRRTPEDGNGMRPVKSSLTDREWEILDLICSGASTREMADELFLSSETVNSHVKRILRKLGVHSRSEAVEMAAQLRGEIFV
jgi:DNA-binding NarL/FixJ family response regulator